MQTCRHGGSYGSGKQHEMSFKQYAEYWQQHKAGGDERLLYLKDWHLVNEHPSYKVIPQ